jgi:hypothetical protein
VTKTNRHLKVTISEVVDMHLGEDEEDNPAFRGVLSMPTKLEVKYARRVKGGSKCEEPLLPVYLDSLVEALAYTMSLTVGSAQDIPIIASMAYMHLTKRLQVYGQARFPDMHAALNEQVRGIINNSTNIGERKQAYAEYFMSQLNGIEKPCKKCDSDDCEFRGQFDADNAK